MTALDSNGLDRIKVLISAYACEPGVGSEQEVGWKWAQIMSKHHDVTVLTRSNSRPVIDRWLSANPECNPMKFNYLDGGPFSLWLKKHVPGGVYLYYIYWQLLARRWLRSEPDPDRWNLVHHVTFASFRMPVGAVGTRNIWGPVGGAETANMRLLEGHGTLLGRIRERLRNAATKLSGHVLRYSSPIKKDNGIALASTPATLSLLEKNGIPSMLMPTIGHDFSPPSEGVNSPSNGKLRILYVGRLHLLKGIHLLLRALPALDQTAYELTLVGSGPELERLRHDCIELGISDNITFYGQVPRGMLPELYERHDLLAAPSLYESGGMAILEAFAHGLPAIVMDCGGPALTVSENCGFKIAANMEKSETIDAISSALNTYINDRNTLREHGSNARLRAQEHYDWSAKEKHMSKIYRELAEKP